jgi:HAD superfamily hydrolase (TIGR01450 family)
VRLDDVRGFVFDIDGTLIHRAGDDVHVQPGAVEVLERIHSSGRRFVLFTNGSHLAPATFAAGLRAVGLPVEDEDVLTPLCSLQSYLRGRRATGSVLLFGTAAAREYLQDAGVRLVEATDAQTVDIVFVAHPEQFEFDDVERAARAVLAGARLLTGSYARAYAGANGPIFSRGAMLTAALAKATGARPVVVGKPSRAALRTISERLGAPPHELVVIGDDAGMDVALGNLGGARTVLVRTGISGAVELERLRAGSRPHAVVDGVAELLDRL